MATNLPVVALDSGLFVPGSPVAHVDQSPASCPGDPGDRHDCDGEYQRDEEDYDFLEEGVSARIESYVDERSGQESCYGDDGDDYSRHYSALSSPFH